MTKMSVIEYQYEEDLQKIESWWKEDKQRQIIRPYPASYVALLRGSIELSYPASNQAKNLWKLLNERKHSHIPVTVGIVNINSVLYLSRAGIETAYVSGHLFNPCPAFTGDLSWLKNVTSTIKEIFKSQVLYDRDQRQRIMQLPAEEREMFPQLNYILPIIADIDMHDTDFNTIMNITEGLVEAGVAMFRIDDSEKDTRSKCSTFGTIIPTSEFLERLTAARLQLDIMGAETLVMSKVDAYQAEFISSLVDIRDHAYVLGATNPNIEPLVSILDRSKMDDSNQRAIAQWMKDAEVLTYDEAVEKIFSESEFLEYQELVSRTQFLSLEGRALVASNVSPSRIVVFDLIKSQSLSGAYMFRPTVTCVVERALAALNISDTTWARMDPSNTKDVMEFQKSMEQAVSARIFGFG